MCDTLDIYDDADTELLEYTLENVLSEDAEDDSEDENEDVEITKDILLLKFADELTKYDIDRASFDFTYNGRDITGVPMAKLSDGNFVFLVDGKMKKICINLISI
jgi:hypothetical protein